MMSSRQRKSEGEVDKIKAKYEARTLAEKRKDYAKKGYVTLRDGKILLWQHYVEKNEVEIKQNEIQQAHYDYPADNLVNSKLSIFVGDITTLEIDAIVNAANEQMLGGGGVDGAIHAAAGEDLYHECVLANGCPPGEAKLTLGYKLPAKYIIHAVGPICRKGVPPSAEQVNHLENAYRNSLELLVKKNLRSIAFPCISTGVYHFPRDKAAKIALKVIREFLDARGWQVDRIILCLYGPNVAEDLRVYQAFTPLYFALPPTSDAPNALNAVEE